MSVKILSPGDQLPPPEKVDVSGLLAVGGSLDVPTLISAYSKGIFPWFSDGEPIMWWSPDPRMVLFPDKLHISSSMRKLIRKKVFNVTIDADFDGVINACRNSGSRTKNTWITNEMVDAYNRFQKPGYAHPVEEGKKGVLAGGLYGIAIGRVFFGESMFFLKENASKYGFIKFVRYLEKRGFKLIDCQIYTDHLASLGATEIPGKDFLEILGNYITEPESGKILFDKTI